MGKSHQISIVYVLFSLFTSIIVWFVSMWGNSYVYSFLGYIWPFCITLRMVYNVIILCATLMLAAYSCCASFGRFSNHFIHLFDTGNSAADPGAVKTNIMREIPSHVSGIAFMSLKLLGILQSPENGIHSILDAALAPPVSISSLVWFMKDFCLNPSFSSCAKYGWFRQFIDSLSLVYLYLYYILWLIESIIDLSFHINVCIYIFQETTGVYFFGGNGRTIKSSELSYNTKLSKDLWDLSSEMFLDLLSASKNTDSSI